MSFAEELSRSIVFGSTWGECDCALKPMETPDNGVLQTERDFVAQRSSEVIEEGRDEEGEESDPNSMALAREAKR